MVRILVIVVMIVVVVLVVVVVAIFVVVVANTRTAHPIYTSCITRPEHVGK